VAKMLKEFKVNEFLSLRLEGDKTFIYVEGKRFDQCRFLLLDVSIEQARSFDEIESIDEAAEKLDRSLERGGGSRTIPPETEFWGHCSNLQVWYEHEYNTRLLHRNLAFPFLKRLADCGDPLAKKVFKEEIAKRLESGFLPVVLYLMKEKYLSYFTSEELFVLMTKYEIWQGVLTAMEAMSDDGDKFEAFYDLMFAIKGIPLMDAFSSRIETLFSDLLTVVESMAAGEAKDDAFSDLVSAIKGTEMMREKFTDLVVAVGNISDDRDKRYAFRDLVSAIKGTEMMREKFCDLLTVVEIISDSWEKRDAFFDLVSAIKETDVMREHFADLLVAVGNISDGWEKCNAFRDLMSAIEGTDVMGEKFCDLISFVETMLDGQDKRNAFRDLMFTIEGTNLKKKIKKKIETLFSNILSSVEAMPDTSNKVNAFSDLVSTIQGTAVMDIFSSRIDTTFSNVLNSVKGMPDGWDKFNILNDMQKFKKKEIIFQPAVKRKEIIFQLSEIRIPFSEFYNERSFKGSITSDEYKLFKEILKKEID